MIISNLPPLVKNITCAITGHRVLTENFNEEKLKKDLERIINKGFSVFLIGMAQGFDLACFKTLTILKKDYPHIKLCAVVPCLDQSKYFSQKDRNEYFEFLEQVDYLAKEEKPYYKGCMLVRNNYLIDNCSHLYAYFNGEKRGGTYYTVKRATDYGVNVEYYGEIS